MNASKSTMTHHVAIPTAAVVDRTKAVYPGMRVSVGVNVSVSVSLKKKSALL